MGVLSRKANKQQQNRAAGGGQCTSSVLFICFLYWLTVYLKSEAHIIVMCCSKGWAGLAGLGGPPDNFCLVCLAIVAVMGCWGPARGDIYRDSHSGSKKDAFSGVIKKVYYAVSFFFAKCYMFLVDDKDPHFLLDFLKKFTWLKTGTQWKYNVVHVQVVRLTGYHYIPAQQPWLVLVWGTWV